MTNQDDSENTLENKEPPEVAEDLEKVEEPKGLSTRDALEVAIAAAKDKEEEAPKREPRRAIVTERNEVKVITKDAPALEAPAEYSREEKDDFRASSRKSQEANLRLHKSRMGTLEQIKRESAELQWSRDLVKQVEPFLKVRGDKEPTHSQLLKALKVINEIDDNPRQALAQILRAKGLDVPRELTQEENKESRNIAETITPLQSRIDALEKRIADEENQKVGAVYVNAFDAFSSATNAGGVAKYPDINNTESGLRLSSQIGSLVGGNSDLSRQFIASVQSRIPNAPLETYYAEAYKFYGGSVDDSLAPRSQNTQTHLQKSARAASSVPSSSSRSADGNGTKRFKTTLEALMHASAELKNQE